MSATAEVEVPREQIPLDHDIARSTSPSAFSVEVEQRFAVGQHWVQNSLHFCGVEARMWARRVCIRSCRRPTPASQACRGPGVGRTGRHGIARSWRAASRASRPAPQNGTKIWQRRSCPALDRDNMDAQDHIGGGDADYAGGGRGDVQAERARDRAIECQGSPRRHRARVRHRGARDQ